jgi:hypothetical protein
MGPILTVRRRSALWRTVVIAGLAVHTATGEPALAQSSGGTSQPTYGGAGLSAPTQPPVLLGEEDRAAKRHTGPTGKPCLSVSGGANAETINPNIFEHVVVADNSCGQLIKMQVCYYKSEHCIPLDVPAYARKQVVLGIMPAMKEFRFEYREQF